MNLRSFFILCSFFLLINPLTGRTADFREYPIGDSIEKNHLNIAAVYFPAVVMDHSSMDHSMHHSMQKGDSAKELAKEKFVKPGHELVHIEADIHATRGNPCGFGAGEWIPYLPVQYQLFKKGEKKPTLSGSFIPMVAKDGPHYGTTLRMPGKGSYRLEYRIGTPTIARHSDPVTGVSPYWKPFTVTFDFEYNGIPK